MLNLQVAARDTGKTAVLMAHRDEPYVKMHIKRSYRDRVEEETFTGKRLRGYTRPPRFHPR